MSQYITPRLLEELQSNDKLKRSATVTTIGSLITDLETNGKHGEENPVYIEIHEHLVRLLKSTATKDRLVCTSLLSALVGIEALETKQKVRMVVQLGNLLKSTDMAVCQDATEVYRQVLQRRWPEAMNSVGKDVEMCIQWLGNHSNKVRQLTALLLLDALSNHAPTSIYAHISRIFTLLGTPLKDKSLEVRLAAARSMGACLRLVPKQEHSPSGVLLSYLYEELQRDQKLGSAESSHAALLQCQELVQFGGSFMLAHFGYASELALSLKEHRDPVVRRAAIGLLPVLAKFSIDKFVTYTIGTDLLLTRSYEFLTKLVRANDNDCATALVALTQITQSSGSQFEQVLDETIMAICNVLEIRAKTRNASTVVDETDDAIFQAISELAATFGSALTQYTSKIMDLMFTVGLSNQLCNSLNALELYVGHLLPDIQDRLLDMISIILANMPFRSAQSFIDNLDARMGYVSLHYPSGEQSGESLKGSSWLDRKLGTGATSESASLVVSSAKKIVVTIDVLKLALNILGTFDFTGCNLSEFIYSTILQYLDHSDIDVRIEALTAVSKIILSNTIYGNIIVGGVKVTEEIVHRLMAMAVTESSDDVRLAAIRMLGKGSYFDFHLSSAQNIQSAYLLVNDENFDIRLAALQIIGRMANRNPAHVTTFLSTVITQLLHTFEHSTDAREREESIHSLAVLACSAEYWMRPYISLIFDVVFKHFDSSPPQLSVRLIDIMAALVQLGSHDLVPYLDKLLECLVHALSDQASAKKRLSAVVALGKCATFCNMTITPYVEYPQLFGLLAAMMKTEGNVIKQEVVRTIGALGAIDPLQYKDALATVDSESKVLDGFSTTTSNSVLVDCTSSKNTDSTKQSSKGKKAYKKRVGPAPNVMTVFNKENEQEYLVGDIHVDSYGVTFSSQPLYYISVAVNSLLRILDSPAESKSHLLAVQALNTMFAPMFNVCGVYMDRVIPSVLRAMKAAPPESAESYIERLGRLIGIAQELSRPYLGPIFDLFNVDGHISEKHQSALIDLVEPIEKAQGGDFGAHTTKVVQFLVSVTNHDNSPQHQLTLKALHVLCILKSSYEDNLFLIIPKLVNLLDVSTTPEDVVIKSLGCIQVVAVYAKCKSFTSRIMSKLIKLLSGTNSSKELQLATMNTLCILMEQLHTEFALYMPIINTAMKKGGVATHYKYEHHSNQLIMGKLIPNGSPQLSNPSHNDSTNYLLRHIPNSDSIPRLPVDASKLRQVWTTVQHILKDDWINWFSGFTVELLSQSSSPALRACSSLAMTNAQLCSELFNAAFVSCWNELSEQYRQELTVSLQVIASHADVPVTLLQTIINLAEYMQRDQQNFNIDNSLLCEYAARCQALASELHLRENEWLQRQDHKAIEELIELNQILDLQESAVGMLNHVHMAHPGVEDNPKWHVRLEHWDDSLASFKRQEIELGSTYDNMLGQMHCLAAMSDWESLEVMHEHIWKNGNQETQMAIAGIGAEMAWAMGEYDRMKMYLSVMPDGNDNKVFYKALLSIHNDDFEAAKRYICVARQMVSENPAFYASKSYSRGYSQVLKCQMLTELEEVITYKVAASKDNVVVPKRIIKTWQNRLSGIQYNVGSWQKLLRVHSLVHRPILNIDSWIKYVNLCRESKKMKTARRAIYGLLKDEANYMKEIMYDPTNRMYSEKLVAQAQEYTRLKIKMIHEQDSDCSSNLTPSNSRRRHSHLMSGSSSTIGLIASPDSLDSFIKLSQQPALVYTYLKFKWEAKECANAFQMLEMFASDYSAKIGFDSQYPGDFISYTNRGSPSEYSIQFEENDDLRLQHLLARFYFKRAEWLSQIQHTGELAQEAHAKANLTGYAAGKDMGPNGRKSSVGNIGNHRSLNPNVVGTSSSTSDMSPSKHSASYAISAEEAQAVEDAEYLYSLKRDRINDVILESYHAAAILDSKWYKAWHFLALRHFQETQKHDIEHSMVSDDIVERHIVPSVHGFFRAIQLSKNDTTLQDTLRLLTVWFNYSEHESVAQAVIDGFGSVPLLTWVQVIPQILARIHLQPRGTSDLIKQLLVEIGKYHPHAVLFSLYVVARGNHKERSCIAKEILKRLHDISPQIVEETEVVSRELIRITLIFPEMWSAGLAQASAAYFEDNNIKEMMDILRPLHIRAENPETLREYHFVQMFRVEISYAQNYLKQYFSSETNRHNPDYIKLAWEVYTHIYNKIKNTMLDFDTLDLTDTAPELLKCHGMSLAVPGTYDPDRPTVRIESFVPMVKVYKTKQKPREIKICGSDGNKYTFVLKGNEDLRQDERAMQLFGLINSLLARNTETSRRSLAIERYPVIPLSSNSGLIGFYPGCENFSEIIKNYRKPRGIIENQEDRYLLQCYPNWDNISDKKKIQFFEYVHRSLPGDDLQKSMWYKSPNAEIWLQRRTNYTRSLAVMSMAGYILGLGDRHPTNMMLHMSTGKVVHIDFGDCFEIATQREKSPETVPFRLTRMFTMPMELGSIEGMFKFTANHTMQVLRSNRDSLMAVLEAFVFDPLVSWSYIGKADNKPAAGMATNNAAFANIDDKYWQRGNPKARAIVKRILDKLMGTDFDPNRQLEVSEQVNSLIEQATSPANLAVLYRGWMPFW